MKNIVILLLVIGSLSVYSQDKINPPKIEISSQYETLIEPNYSGFKLGWNWGSTGKKMDDALDVNFYHDFDLVAPQNSYHSNTKLIMNLHTIIWENKRYVTGGRQDMRILAAYGMQIEPTLMPENTGKNLIPRPYDNTGAVFGFLEKNKVHITSNHQDADYHRVKLLKEDLLSGPELVLSDLSEKSALRFLNYDVEHDYLGEVNIIMRNRDDNNTKKMFLSINLKSLEEIPPELENEVILSIKLPYKTYNENTQTQGTGFIVFKSFPQVSGNINNDTIPIIGSRDDYRGTARITNIGTTENTNTWNITGGMLRADTEGSVNKNITLTAYFLCNYNGTPNPIFKPDWWEHQSTDKFFIDTLDMEVTYHGHLDIAIDWFRFETPWLQRLMRGEFDSDIEEIYEHNLNLMYNNADNAKIHRIYLDDELIPHQYVANRYFNMLIDGIGVTELSVKDNPYKQHMQATGVTNFWNGDNIGFDMSIPTPTIRKVDQTQPIENYLKYKFGFAINKAEETGRIIDTLNSMYETIIFGPNKNLPFPAYINPFELTHGYYNGPNPYYSHSTQFQYELCMYMTFYKNPQMLYSNKEWWSNVWLTSTWAKNEPEGILYLEDPVETAELIRLQITVPILMGAKGLFYWKKRTAHIDEKDLTTLPYWPALLPHNYNVSSNGLEFLQSDLLGGDYINPNNDPNNFHLHFNPNYYDYATMGINQYRHYIGLKSSRLELYKQHAWIRNNENVIMNLRLQAWYGKGFKKLEHQHPDLQEENILQKFVNLNGTLTRKLFQPTIIGGSSNPPYEHRDSAFFDITLLKHEDHDLMDVFYIGVQNRRTDPLIFVRDTVDRVPIRELQFYSSAEFDDFCENGGNTIHGNPRTAEFWREQYWKRLGCREINLQFDYSTPDSPHLYNLLQITELKADDAYDANWSWWQKDRYNRYIDTVIGQDTRLAINFLPGEGKIFKVKVLKPDITTTGYLEHSNQSKFVGFPVLDGNGNVLQLLNAQISSIIC